MYFFRFFLFFVLISQFSNASYASYSGNSVFFNSKKKKVVGTVFGVSLTAYLFYKFFYRAGNKKNKNKSKTKKDTSDVTDKEVENTKIEFTEIRPTFKVEDDAPLHQYLKKRNKDLENSQYKELLQQKIDQEKLKKLFEGTEKLSSSLKTFFENDTNFNVFIDAIKKNLNDEEFLNLYREAFPFLPNNQIFCSKTCSILMNFIHQKKDVIFGSTFFDIQIHLFETIANDENFEFDDNSKLAIRELLTNFLDTEKNNLVNKIDTIQLLQFLALYFQSGAANFKEAIKIIDQIIKFYSIKKSKNEFIDSRFSKLLEQPVDLNLLEKTILTMLNSLKFENDTEVTAYNVIHKMIECIFKKSSSFKNLKTRKLLSDQDFKVCRIFMVHDTF